MRVALAAALAAAIFTWLTLQPHTRGNLFRVDEVHKISEAFALRLLLEGRWDEFPRLVDRSNGPFGKYAFGLAVLAAGEELPKTPLLARLPPKAVTEPFVDSAYARPYLPLLKPCRHVSLLATALTAGLIAFAAARIHSLAAAAIASAWSALHWLTATFAGDAIFDPLLAFLVFATLPLVLFPRRMLVLAPVAGLFAAMAFQTRLTGGIALAATLAVLLLHRNGKAALLAVLAFAAATFAVNPYYWPDPIDRFAQELSYLRTVLGAVTSDGVRLPLWAAADAARTPVEWTLLQKLRFTWIALGDLLLASAAAGSVLARRERALLAWSAVVILGILLWLPLPWARYLLVVLPPLALFAGIACAEALRGVFEAWRWRMRQPAA